MVTCGNFMVQAYIYSTKEVFHTGEGNFEKSTTGIRGYTCGWLVLVQLSGHGKDFEHDFGHTIFWETSDTIVRHTRLLLAKIVKIKQNYVHHHVFHGHLILIEWLIVTGADSENLISVKRYDFDFQWRHYRYYVNVSTDHFQFRMDDEETIYSTEIQLEIGELKVVEEEIVYTWGKFNSSSAWPRYLTLKIDYIDVGDRCWRRNVLVTILRCWWRFWSPTSSIS